MRLPIRWEYGVALLFLIVGVVAVEPVLHGQNQAPDAARKAGDAEQPQPLGGDAEPQADEAADEGAAGDSSSSILTMIVGSGVTGMLFMGILGLFSIIAGTVAVERAINMRRSRILPRDLSEVLESFARRRGDVNRLRELCSSGKSVLATILQAALLRQGQPLSEVEKSMEDTAAREMSELRARIHPLITVGSIAPLVGLLGTVVGMIIAFHTASQAGLGKAELLAKGIYMALLTTAGGLSVAIPSLLLSSFFSGRINRFFREIDRSLMPLLPALAGASPPPSKPLAADPVPAAREVTEVAQPRATVPADQPAQATVPADEPAPRAAAPPAHANSTRNSSNPLMADGVRPR